VKREAYLDTKNTKYEARNPKQYQNLNDPNSKLCLDCQIKVYVRVSADTKTCGSPLNLTPPTGKGASYWRFMFACWQICENFNIISSKNQQENE